VNNGRKFKCLFVIGNEFEGVGTHLTSIPGMTTF